ncbi:MULTISPECIES: TDT family transporter [unclassified Pseudomonas]|uniref:TDT family transporter n=1 Tax=unclassified Pseudomonas TaxID=196821 RepID=UPI0008771E45|nr:MULTISPECIES: TDT family transporter [unclassified Pseudomonas]SCZ62673.1 C4-dicarboxylate transporter/malic acid transport protein [Pseudomonas sp. NFPP17]SDA58232.1 C4-dicarboxylate transporter/malic acid transport protein [Pseudomonas sp. NFPP15]SEK69822.1 C4-dicarboxylate transporter/malic acid transport protein [Pseudomonas sp. NFPP18]SFA56155.1 C4-dicarboxylate transporter/malic acid transport protein [Pseudomonas sp. NFPP13]SFT66767.1 C4-dicarboxylate transporter/malic acid transport
MTCPNSVKTGHWPLSHLPHPLEAIRQFTPNWFAATMGTGVLALALAQWPAEVSGLHQVAEGFWWLTIALFLLFTAMYTARWVLFFDEARRIFGHSTVSMFFGTIPMGLATIINGLLVFGMPRWGDGVVEVAQLLWWLDVAMSLACGILIPYMMFTRQEHSIDQMTAVWLLPVVAAEVAAASGGLLAPHLPDAHGQLVMLSTSYVLWAFSLPVAFSILTILLLRMALHKLPHESMAASSWLALGPIGTGALGMLVLGADAPAIFAANGLPGVGEIAAGLGLVAGLTLWGFGLWWMLMAVLITRRYLREGIPFNLGWWGFTFPLGVYSLATLKLGSTLHLGFFSVFGAVLVAALAVMWLIVAKRTVQGAYKGELFVSPCIAGLRK